MSPNRRGEPDVAVYVAATSTRRSVRLPFLYVGFLASALMAAWLASIGMGPSSSVSLPAAAPVRPQVRRSGPVATSVITLPAGGDAQTYAVADHETAGALSPVVQSGAPVTPAVATTSTIQAPPAEARVVVSRAPVVTIPTSGSDNSSPSSSDSSSSESSSRSTTTAPTAPSAPASTGASDP